MLLERLRNLQQDFVIEQEFCIQIERLQSCSFEMVKRFLLEKSLSSDKSRLSFD